MVQCQLQALLGIKVEPKETLEEVKEEEGLKSFRWGLAVEEEENQRMWAAERERRMALDYYVDMALTNGGVPKNSGRKRKRKGKGEENGPRLLCRHGINQWRCTKELWEKEEK